MIPSYYFKKNITEKYICIFFTPTSTRVTASGKHFL